MENAFKKKKRIQNLKTKMVIAEHHMIFLYNLFKSTTSYIHLAMIYLPDLSGSIADRI